MSLVGSKIGHIRITEALGRGGMGEVYIGFDETLKRQVAVKAIRADARLHPQAKARFLREAQILSSLQHPSICQIHDFIEEEDRDYLVLELIEGRDLGITLDDSLSTPQKLKIAEQLAQVLAAAHEKGVVHRDLKPSNVMLTATDEIKVLDFGLARVTAGGGAGQRSAGDESEPAATETELDIDQSALTLTFPGPPTADAALVDGSEPAVQQGEGLRTRPGTVMGTPAYMSPEQARGEPATAAGDMYSLGLVLQHLFTGKPPYPLELDSRELMRRVRAGETLPVEGIDSDLAELIRRLESPAPGARPTALEAAARLRWIREKPRRRIRNLVVAAILALFVFGGLKYTFDLRRERTAALTARDQAEQARDEVQSVVDFLVDLFEVSDPGQARGNTITAREILDKGSRQITHQLADRPLTRARMMETIGTVYRKLGLYEDARPLLEAALDTRRQELGAEHLTVSESVDSLAALYERQGSYAEAEALFRQALAVRERKLGADDPAVADTLQGLGLLYLKQGRFAEAEPIYLRALTIREQKLGPEHPQVAATLRDLGILSYSLGRYDEAEQLYLQALAIRRQSLGPDHPDVGNTLNSLASLYLTLGRFEEAESLYQEALAIREKTLGVEHPDVAISLNNLALLYFYQDRYDEAEPLYQRSLDIRQKTLGPEHPDVAESLGNLAYLYYYQERLDEAESLYRRALAIKETSLPADHPSVAETLNALGSLYDDLGRYRQAEGATVRAVAIREAALGPEHPALAESLFWLAHIYHHHLERFDEAEELYARALDIRRQALEPDDPDLATTAQEYAEFLRQRGRTEEAESLLQSIGEGEDPTGTPL